MTCHHGLNYCVFDAAVNSGTGQRRQMACRRLWGLFLTVLSDANTLAKVAEHSPDALINAYCDIRMNFLKGLLTFEIFGRGWTRRVDEVRKVSLDASR
jgi:lysozyme family protein